MSTSTRGKLDLLAYLLFEVIELLVEADLDEMLGMSDRFKEFCYFISRYSPVVKWRTITLLATVFTVIVNRTISDLST